MPKSIGNPKGGKHVARGNNAEGPNSANTRRTSVSTKQRGGDGGGGKAAPNPAGVGIINEMNRATTHTTYGKGETKSR